MGGPQRTSRPKAHQAGGRRGKERAARNERSSDWRRGAASSPDPEASHTLTCVKTFGLTLCLQADPAKIAEYRRYHADVWPEVTARLRECGIQQMEIFLRDRRMFMHIVTDDNFDPNKDFARINEDPVSAKWNELMATLQERAPEASPDEWWAPMEKVFDLQRSS